MQGSGDAACLLCMLGAVYLYTAGLPAVEANCVRFCRLVCRANELECSSQFLLVSALCRVAKAGSIAMRALHMQ
jgi:hypothetical protein